MNDNDMNFEDTIVQWKKIVKKNIFNDSVFFNYRYKRVRELYLAFLFAFVALIFKDPITLLNINILNAVGYSFYLPIFTIETVLGPVLLGKITEYIMNHKSNNKEAIVRKMKIEIENDYIFKYLEILNEVIDNIRLEKEFLFPLSIEKMTEEELIQESYKIIGKKVLEKNSKKLEKFNSFYVVFFSILNILPIVLFESIFSSIGLTSLNNTYILDIIFWMLGFGICRIEANKYNIDLEDAINYVKKSVDTNYTEADLKTLIKACQVKTYKKEYEKSMQKIEEKFKEKEDLALEKQKTFRSIPPKVVDCEFKGNPEEKRNAKVLRRELKR